MKTPDTEIIFAVEEASEGGYTGRALGASIFVEGDDLEELRRNIVDAVRCHFEDRSGCPKVDSSVKSRCGGRVSMSMRNRPLMCR
jgi:hypothetical protein